MVLGLACLFWVPEIWGFPVDFWGDSFYYGKMGKYEKLLLKILQATSDNNIPFDSLCTLLKKLGFQERIRGSHHNFSKPGISAKINLQKDGSHAKRYQIRQVREIITRYGLGGIDEF